ncbi:MULTISPECIES: YpoC family protein [Lysinibacillus]|uniref:YpoC-like domain-containing protein n=1 Tax=Lysinibacillus antri TaxID=2498145 RepID=A0A3S0RKT7_9BACI|nr:MULTISPECIES: hypothetical protein [Lysinibacillus]RUL55506.1 hypothetical protein EK386_04040 [Lysinibacillus antri]TSI09070.1 hypothetical protein FJQ64_05905 [Lysinibacillus sp. BW-2-10]
MIHVNTNAIDKDKTDPYFEQWEKLSQLIFEAHDERSGEAKSLMEQGISLFEQCVIFCSEADGMVMNEKEQYEVLPINGMERFQFIKARPAQYACYRQLDELFKEMRKRLARLRIKSK